MTRPIHVEHVPTSADCEGCGNQGQNTRVVLTLAAAARSVSAVLCRLCRREAGLHPPAPQGGTPEPAPEEVHKRGIDAFYATRVDFDDPVSVTNALIDCMNAVWNAVEGT